MYRYFLVPFYVNFWIEKFKTNEAEFKDPALWKKKNEMEILSEPWETQLKKLFNVLTYQLNLNVGQQILDWLKI